MSDQSDPDRTDADAGDGPADVTVDGVTDGDAASVQIDGQEVPVEADGDLAAAVREADDVELSDVLSAATGGGDTNFKLGGSHDAGDTATIPVQDVRDWDLTSSGLTTKNRFSFIQDDRIQKLEQNSVTYTEEVGDWILSKDDLVPAIKERLKALIMGEGGLQVEPEDPNSDADQKLAQHLDDVYRDDVRPTKVLDNILDENLKNARAVLRSTDLQPLELGNLDYIRDGVTGEEIYWQSDTSVWTFDVPDDGDVDDAQDLDLSLQDVDGQPLVVGEHVFDITLYDKPPLEAVADTVVNKKQMQRLKARKAEITSFGGIYVKVNPPDYLPEDEYFDRVEDDDGNTKTKLERALEQNLDSAFDWAKGYQSGTTGSVPMHWEVEQIDIPEGDQALDEQIRGYNKDISRRLLVPIDLIELREGSELSRKTLMQTLMTTVQGWRQEVIRIFDAFADVQADIHGLDGDVEHQFPPLDQANVDAITKLLQFAGVLGATSDELRQMVNQIQGVELPTDQDVDSDDGDLPQSGGPDDPDQRSDQMRDFLDDQGDDAPQDQDRSADQDQDPPTSREEAMRRGWSPTGTVDTDAALAAAQFSEGQKVDTPAGRGVVVEVRTSSFTGPDGDEVDASDDQPAYVVAVEDGARVYQDSDLTADDWSTDVDSPTSDLAAAVQAQADAGGIDLEAGPGDFDYPDSWTKSDTPARLILLDAWSSMGGQFDCGGDCCHGTMVRNGMSDRAANQFCAAMKDRVLMWEGWRKGGGAAASAGQQDVVTAAHGFTAPSLREAAHKVRRVVEDQLGRGQTVDTVRDGPDKFRVLIHDQDGDIQGTMVVRESSVKPTKYLVTGTSRFFRHLTDFQDEDRKAQGGDGGVLASFRDRLGI